MMHRLMHFKAYMQTKNGCKCPKAAQQSTTRDHKTLNIAKCRHLESQKMFKGVNMHITLRQAKNTILKIQKCGVLEGRGRGGGERMGKHGPDHITPFKGMIVNLSPVHFVNIKIVKQRFI